jgi:hypothetical protein
MPAATHGWLAVSHFWVFCHIFCMALRALCVAARSIPCYPHGCTVGQHKSHIGLVQGASGTRRINWMRFKLMCGWYRTACLRFRKCHSVAHLQGGLSNRQSVVRGWPGASKNVDVSVWSAHAAV